MSPAAWIGVIAALVAIVGAIVGYGKSMVQAPLVAKGAKLEAEKAQVEAARADLERQLAEGREHLAELDSRYRTLQQDFVSLKLNKTGVLLKHEIDTDLLQATSVLRVHESSILLPGPPTNVASFVFLSIYGPAAEKLRKTKLPRKKGSLVGCSPREHCTTPLMRIGIQTSSPASTRRENTRPELCSRFRSDTTAQ